MGLKYVSAYLLTVLSGKDEPTSADLKKIIEAAGGEFDSALADKLISEMKGKVVHEVIAKGREQLQGFGGGGGGAAAGGAAAGGDAPAAEAKKEEVVEEEEEEMEFDLFD
ncbi:unnamed protein product [Amoebophrya sp. A120]|nr:unnamed protein product [Amoebophrya sp. A120]|eukprot:GSA120T00004115001.1